ncbi:hypothetical protein POSPLADRAFT_1062026 [Postia placenta MAD-698-R-SB12]|uniref:C2H2-type domain-containing protein n=1 Tax=Postia placenta MAD-698-R-SB12 TaxID=670580 RepID=A0A1X6MKN4_9APHY|nr:hypothetical protein POSPLADRAFT_1062026 [Postia placenta MAD-698-R-SB12]OSX56878.1 hypothetical protein POSPLADRAFT_1062026 [Postia placenta MAD-698-R-SB12]
MDTTRDLITTLELLQIFLQDASGDDRHAAVCLLTDKLVLASSSRDLPFAAATSGLGYTVAVKARTKAIEDTLNAFNLESAIEIAGIHIPIVASQDALSDACAYDAVLVRQDRVLVVWGDRTTAIVRQFCQVEHRLRHLVGECICDAFDEPSDRNLATKDHGRSLYPGYNGFIDETFKRRMLEENVDPSESIPKEEPAVNPTLTLRDPSVGFWAGSNRATEVRTTNSGRRARHNDTLADASGSVSGVAATSHTTSYTRARISRAVTACPRKMGKTETSPKYGNTSSNMGASDNDDGDSSRDDNDDSAVNLVGEEIHQTYATSGAYTTRFSGRTSQSRGGEHVPLLNSTATGPTRRSQPSRSAKRKSPSTDNNGHVDGSSDSRNKKQKTKHAAPPRQQKKFVCPREKCKHQGFKSQSDFRCHLRSCFEIKQFFCPRCGNTFARIDATNRHVKSSCNGSQGPTGDGDEGGAQLGNGSSANMESDQVSDAIMRRRATELDVSIEDLIYVLGFLTKVEAALLFSGGESNGEDGDGGAA